MQQATHLAIVEYGVQLSVWLHMKAGSPTYYLKIGPWMLAIQHARLLKGGHYIVSLKEATHSPPVDCEMSEGKQHGML